MKIRDVLSPLRTIRTISVSREVAKADAAFNLSLTPTLVPPRLYVIELGPGDHGSINVGWYKNGAQQLDPQAWLSQGYDGVVFRGAGVDVTHVRCTSWDGITLAVGRHNGVVRFENMTVHSGHEKASAFGEQNIARALSPSFRVEIENVKGVVDSPESYRERRTVNGGDKAPYEGTLTASGKPDVYLLKGADIPHVGTLIGLPRRPKWFWFAYNCDLILRNVQTFGADLVEHNLYAHGFARYGLDIDGCLFDGSGSQHVKIRSDAFETAWAGPEQVIRIRRTTFRDNMRPWSWRGPGMIVCEGTACHVYIWRCLFYGGVPYPGVNIADRSRAIQISSEGNSYAHKTGEIGGNGFGNGVVWISECAAFGAADNFWSNEIVRCGRNGGSQSSARLFLMDRCGVWGRNVQVQLGAIPTGKAVVRNCNTPEIVEICRGLGFETSPEAVIATASRLVPLSSGFAR